MAVFTEVAQCGPERKLIAAFVDILHRRDPLNALDLRIRFEGAMAEHNVRASGGHPQSA